MRRFVASTPTSLLSFDDVCHHVLAGSCTHKKTHRTCHSPRCMNLSILPSMLQCLSVGLLPSTSTPSNDGLWCQVASGLSSPYGIVVDETNNKLACPVYVCCVWKWGYTPKLCGHLKKDDGEPLTSGFREFYHVLPTCSGPTWRILKYLQCFYHVLPTFFYVCRVSWDRWP